MAKIAKIRQIPDELIQQNHHKQKFLILMNFINEKFNLQSFIIFSIHEL
jgi:hypothetical protein